MSLVGFKARNHPQQTGKGRGAAERDQLTTPPELFDPLHAEFRFTVDAAATATNARLPRFWTEVENGLAQPWADERVWCNPPYSAIRPWVEKMAEDAAELAVMLLPANRCEQAWWQDLVEPVRDRPGSGITTRFLRGRPRFILHGHDKVLPNERPPFGLVLVIWESA